MSDPNPSFFIRIFIAFIAYWRILFDAAFAARFVRLKEGQLPAETPKPEAVPAPRPEPVTMKEATPDAALQLLGILQREGRFIDFLEENVAQFSDEEIGAAARVVHDGCHKAIHEHFELTPVRSEAEETKIRLEPGFDAGETRLTGNVVGEPPFTGTLTHRGWRVTKVALPKFAEEHDVSIVAPAEVEL